MINAECLTLNAQDSLAFRGTCLLSIDYCLLLIAYWLLLFPMRGN